MVEDSVRPWIFIDETYQPLTKDELYQACKDNNKAEVGVLLGCVNLHDELVATLKDTREYVQNMLENGDPGGEADLIAYIDEVLIKARKIVNERREVV